MTELFAVLRRPVVTEKNTALQGQNKYTFEVAPRANKLEVKAAVEKVFKVKVTGVHIIHVPGKQRRIGRRVGLTPAWKKAIVTLKPGDKIQIFEGV